MTMKKPEVVAMEIMYAQEQDACGPISDTHQYLTVKAEIVEDGPDGFYMTLSTERWSIDDPKEIAAVLEDFTKRYNHANEQEGRSKDDDAGV